MELQNYSENIENKKEFERLVAEFGDKKGTRLAIESVIRKDVVYNKRYRVVRKNGNTISNKALFESNEDAILNLYDVVLVLTEDKTYYGNFFIYMGYDESTKSHKFIY